jgi:hypothetical protein
MSEWRSQETRQMFPGEGVGEMKATWPFHSDKQRLGNRLPVPDLGSERPDLRINTMSRPLLRDSS